MLLTAENNPDEWKHDLEVTPEVDKNNFLDKASPSLARTWQVVSGIVLRRFRAGGRKLTGALLIRSNS